MASYANFMLRTAAVVLLGASLAACSGSDGKDGAAGPAGPQGPTGPAGPAGPGSGVPIDSAELINIEVTSVAVPAGGGAPTVELSLTNDLTQGLFGLPAGDIRFVISQLSPGTGGGSSEWQSYVTRDSGGIPDAQADAERGSAGTWVDNSDGTYQYTFAQALTAYPAGPVFDETKTHRLGIEIRGQAPISSNGIYTFVPAGGDPLFERRIVDNDTCFACHDIINFHGGPRTDIDYCVTCHNPSSIDGDTAAEPWGGTVDMKQMVHKIHFGANLTNGYYIVGYGGPEDFSDIRFPQDVRNCTTCHDESDANTPQASNWRQVQNTETCGSCHDNIDFAAGDHVGGINDNSTCVQCHGPDSTVNGGALRVEVVHELQLQLTSKNFQYNIENVLNMAVGQNPEVQFSVTNPNDGSYYDILNDTEWTTCAGGASRLQIGIAWNTDDYTNTNSGADPAQPMAAGLNALACFGNPGATPVAANPGWFSVTSATPLPADAVGTAAVTIDGHPAVELDLNGDGTFEFERIPVKNVFEYVGIDGATVVERREVVEIENCDNCHKELSLHGNNRTDEPQVCVTCHNPNATDARQRTGDPCVATLGTDDVPIDFKYMVHAIHASPETGVPYQVCGYNNSVHEYSEANVHYPGHIENCEACHIKKANLARGQLPTYFPVDPGKVLGTTVSVGADPTPIDDVVISPNTAACSACHVSDLAKTHMMQNGGDFNAGKAADSSLISSGVETCALCHGPGRTADVVVVHGVRDFPLN
jgi:OmcA/MtrC family decaheme c-type cytochrome